VYPNKKTGDQDILVDTIYASKLTTRRNITDLSWTYLQLCSSVHACVFI